MLKRITTALVFAFLASHASAATAWLEIDTNNTIEGVIACSCLVDGEGADWTGLVVLIELTSGSVYNGGPDSDGPQSGFWGVPGFEILEWDTWFGVPGDATNGIAGGAGDLGNNVKSTAGSLISVTAFNTTTTDTGPTRVANISLSNDAAGTASFIFAFEGGELIRFDGAFEGGLVCWPEPTTATMLGLGCLCLCRRRGS